MTSGQWFNLSLVSQLGNIGSEFERCLSWRQKGKQQLFESAFARMLELMDLTVADQRWHNHRLKEILRLRETICSLFFEQGVDAAGLQKYLLQYATLARTTQFGL